LELLTSLICTFPSIVNYKGASCTFFYEILVAASIVRCASRTAAVASRYEISQTRNFFATVR